MNWRLLLFLPFIWACDDYNDCDVIDLSEELYMEFRSFKTKSALEVEFNAIEFIHSRGQISYIDTIPSTGRILPIDLTDNLVSYRFTTDSADYEFELWYDLEAIIENPECGATFRVKNLNYNQESLTFDSAAFQVTELTKLLAPHVEVYF